MNETANETPPERTKAKRTNGTVYLTVRTFSFVRPDIGLTTRRRRPPFQNLQKIFRTFNFRTHGGVFNHIAVRNTFGCEIHRAKASYSSGLAHAGLSRGAPDRSGPAAKRIGGKGPCGFAISGNSYYRK